MCEDLNVLKSHWHRFSCEKSYFSHWTLSWTYHSIKQFRSRTKSRRLQCLSEKASQSTWRIILVTVPTCSQLLSVLLHRLEEAGPPLRFVPVVFRKFPHMPRKPGMCGSYVCCLHHPRSRPGARNLKPFPGRREPRQVKRREKARPGESCWEGPQHWHRLSVDWVLKVTTAIYGGGGEGDFNCEDLNTHLMVAL